jgi:hypothetical protein
MCSTDLTPHNREMWLRRLLTGFVALTAIVSSPSPVHAGAVDPSIRIAANLTSSGYVVDYRASIVATASQGISSVSCALDGEAWDRYVEVTSQTTTSLEATITWIEEGTLICTVDDLLSVSAQDQFEVKLDGVPPTVGPVIFDPRDQRNNEPAEVTVAAHDEASGLASASFAMSGGVHGRFHMEIPMTLEDGVFHATVSPGLPFGQYTVNVRVFDEVGHVANAYVANEDPGHEVYRTASTLQGQGRLTPNAYSILPGIVPFTFQEVRFTFDVFYPSSDATEPSGVVKARFEPGNFRMRSTSLRVFGPAYAGGWWIAGKAEVVGQAGVFRFVASSLDTDYPGETRPEEFELAMWPEGAGLSSTPTYLATGPMQRGWITASRGGTGPSSR